jgi:hypothetical protein
MRPVESINKKTCKKKKMKIKFDRKNTRRMQFNEKNKK